MSAATDQEDTDISFLINQCFEFANDVSNIQQLLRTYKDNLVFQFNSGELTRLIRILNVNLNNQVTNTLRQHALFILDALLPQCSPDLFIDNAVFWMQSCLKNSDDGLFRALELKLLESMILSSVHFTDIRKHISHQILPEFMDQIKCSTQMRTEVRYRKVKCIIVFLQHFGEACGSFKTRIISFLTDALKTQRNTQVFNVAARCYAMTTQCGQKGKGLVNYVTNWSEQLDLLVNTLHHIINAMLRNITLESEEISGHICIGLLNEDYETTSNVCEKYFIFRSNFKTVSIVIAAMFLTSFPAKKVFDPRNTLRLIFRIANFNLKSLSTYTETNDTIAIKLILSEIHEHNFNMLGALVKCASRNLIPYGPSVCRVCIQGLVYSRLNVDSNMVTSCQKIREAAYSVLSLWLHVATSSCSIEEFTEELVKEIVSDIVCKKEPLVLLIKNRKDAKSKGNKVNLVKHEDVYDLGNKSNISICVKSHRMLQCFITSGGFSKVKYYQILRDTVISQVASLLPDKRTLKAGALYSNSACRLKLYQSLLALIMNPPPNHTTPVSNAFDLFTKGMLDSDIEISKFCTCSLNTLRTIIHPRGPTLDIFKPGRNELPINDSKSYECSIIENATFCSSDVENKVMNNNDIVEDEAMPTNDVSVLNIAEPLYESVDSVSCSGMENVKEKCLESDISIVKNASNIGENKDIATMTNVLSETSNNDVVSSVAVNSSAFVGEKQLFDTSGTVVDLNGIDSFNLVVNVDKGIEGNNVNCNEEYENRAADNRSTNEEIDKSVNDMLNDFVDVTYFDD